MAELTPAQKKILNFIAGFIGKKGYAPTTREIADKMGYVSTNAAHEQVRKLVSKGYIKVALKVHRGIQVLDDGQG